MLIITGNDPEQKASRTSAHFGLNLTWVCDVLKMAPSLTFCRSPTATLPLQRLHSSTIHFVINFFYTAAFEVPGNKGSCHGDSLQTSSCNT